MKKEAFSMGLHITWTDSPTRGDMLGTSHDVAELRAPGQVPRSLRLEKLNACTDFIEICKESKPASS